MRIKDVNENESIEEVTNCNFEIKLVDNSNKSTDHLD